MASGPCILRAGGVPNEHEGSLPNKSDRMAIPIAIKLSLNSTSAFGPHTELR
jgi:hypothetical protein